MNSRMSGWSTSSTTILAARRVLPPDLIVPGPGVGAAHERDGPRRRAALGERLHRAADVREVDARARAAAEDHALLGVPVEDRLHRVLDGEDEAGAALRALLEADVEPHRRVEGRHLVQQDVRQLGVEGVGVLFACEVAAGATPAGDRAGDAADHLLDRALALGRAELSAEVLLGDDVRRVLRPGLRELDAGAARRRPSRRGRCARRAAPTHGVEGVRVGRGEQAFDRERGAGGCLLGMVDCGVGFIGFLSAAPASRTLTESCLSGRSSSLQVRTEKRIVHPTSILDARQASSRATVRASASRRIRPMSPSAKPASAIVWRSESSQRGSNARRRAIAQARQAIATRPAAIAIAISPPDRPCRCSWAWLACAARRRAPERCSRARRAARGRARWRRPEGGGAGGASSWGC